MSRLVWGETGKRLYETGVDRGVFYPQDGVGVPWNGLIAVSEAPSGADLIEGYYDGEKTISQRQRESFAAKISAYTYPKEFEKYDGLIDSHADQRRKLFGLSYRTLVSNDLGENDHQLIHLVYNALATPSDQTHSSFGLGSEASVFEWDIQTIPEILSTGEFSAHVIVNTSAAYPWAVATFEDVLYGTSSTDPRFPSIHEVIEIFENASILRVTNHGDGTATIDGPDDAVFMVSPTLWTINWPSVVQIDTNRYQIKSL